MNLKKQNFSCEQWQGKYFSFFSHLKCEAFPCHKTDASEDFNCLFCFCPLYFMGDQCGGDFILLESGIKDCSVCALPHKRENYGYIMERLFKAMRCGRKEGQ